MSTCVADMKISADMKIMSPDQQDREHLIRQISSQMDDNGAEISHVLKRAGYTMNTLLFRWSRCQAGKFAGHAGKCAALNLPVM